MSPIDKKCSLRLNDDKKNSVIHMNPRMNQIANGGMGPLNNVPANKMHGKQNIHIPTYFSKKCLLNFLVLLYILYRKYCLRRIF